MIDSLVNAFRIPDLRRKLLYTFGMLVIFRFISHVPVPGVNAEALRRLFESNQLIGMLDLFSGGAMSNFSVAAMGVYPYITATIIMQLLIPMVPALQDLSKEGESGRNKLNQYMHWLTVPLAFLQALGTGSLLASSQLGVIPNFNLVSNTIPTLAIIMTMTAGTVLLVWIGELITENGIGNGVSIIIFAGIVAKLPSSVVSTLVAGTNYLGVIVFAILGLLTVAAIVVVQEGQRRIPVQFAKRIRGNRMYGGSATHIPMRVNSAGMIPLIFAMSIMLFPGTVASYFVYTGGFVGDVANFFANVFNPAHIVYWVLYFFMVVAFTFFYTMVIFQQQNIPESLQKNGGFVPGIRPGRPTGEYLNKVLIRITWFGAIFLGVIAILPFFVQNLTSVQALTLSSTALLIVVGVVLDTMKQLESQLLMRNYQGFIK
ncbi:MAG TPA: preprotein translocase subunit SecY [Chloroflexota bacterium]|nr:preprotein translocase subunit SecY [Chloroflexota bacterium]HEX2987670.1 preprotein translocase subunit SecY [Chloroflexota bacterium]